ncbi:MAG: T9SS type A sorting domain-containing protein, partial [Bacteroidia bacterium]|nr:T9SS type A sorting domain-containing protein [Bacteroidia bacterium]
NKIILQGYQSSSGNELFSSDGTASGTILLKDLKPGSSGSDPRFFKNAIGKVFFRMGTTVFGDSLFVTDGTSNGTFALCKYPTFQILNFNSIEMNGRFYFVNSTTANGDELWVSDGTITGTQLLKDINPGSATSNPANFEVLNNKLYFSANDGANGEELWVTDGTAAGTVLFKDIYAGATGSQPQSLKKLNGKIYFGANAGSASGGKELWETDGTNAGTVMLKDIIPGNTGSSPNSFYEFNNKLYFSAEGPAVARELYVTDGTAAGTSLVADISPGTNSSLPFGFCSSGSNLYFSATNINTCGYELFSYSPVTNSVTLMMDAIPGTTHGFNNAVVDETIAYVGSYGVAVAKENNNLTDIWLSNGTPGGTSKIKYTVNTYTTAEQIYFQLLNNELYFYGSYGSGDFGLFKLSNLPLGTANIQKQVVQFSIYPNPAKEMITVKQEMPDNEGTQITLSNVLGQVLLSESTYSNPTVLKTDNLKNGVYYLTIENKGVQSTQKIIIEH